ncbi:MAG: hypothetical protein ACTSYY_08095, partial [Promethearchaeota archaeon]
SFNQLTSLEDLPYEFDDIISISKYRVTTRKRIPNIRFSNNPIRTFSGIKFRRIIENLHNNYPEYFNYSNFQLCPAFLNLFKKYNKIKQEYSLRLNKYNEYDEFISGCIDSLSHDYDDIEMPTVEDFKRYEREISALETAIKEFYHKTPMQLAQQYVESPHSLTSNELERLAWESGYRERELLESNFSPDNPVLKEISKRLTHKLSSGLKILK